MLRFSLVSPEQTFIDEDCVWVTLPGLLGEVQVLAGHTPCLLELKAGQIFYENSQRETRSFYIASGFAEIDRDQLSVLCEKASVEQLE
jgi:F-type H+-transporting ATPase subunit epsilon